MTELIEEVSLAYTIVECKFHLVQRGGIRKKGLCFYSRAMKMEGYIDGRHVKSPEFFERKRPEFNKTELKLSTSEETGALHIQRLWFYDYPLLSSKVGKESVRQQ